MRREQDVSSCLDMNPLFPDAARALHLHRVHPLVLCFAPTPTFHPSCRSFFRRAPAHAPSPRGYPRLGFSAATILPSIPSPLLFPHHANTLPADLTLRDPECSRSASHRRPPLHACTTFASADSRPRTQRQTAVSTATTRLRCITFALASRAQVPACPRRSHPTKVQGRIPVPRIPYAYFASGASGASVPSVPSPFETPSRLLEGHAGHVHSGIGHLQKQRQSRQTLQRHHLCSLQ
jgi:hypothetical protein